MPEELRALLIILVLASAVFAFARTPACAVASTARDFVRRRNLWFAITLVVFLAHNFWIYVIAAAMLLLIVARREQNTMAMFFFVLFAVPSINATIPGFGIVDNLFEIHYVRLLSLVLLLPAFLVLRRQPDVAPLGSTLPDKLVLGYVVLRIALQFTTDSLTETVRTGVFYRVVDIVVPYYVASRGIKNLQGFRDALMSFVVAALVVGAIACFEFLRSWLLYSIVDQTMDIRWTLGRYLLRADAGLRAMASTGHPIALGYVLAVAAGFLLYLKKSVPNTTAWSLGLLLLIGGLVASLSRGPWVGAAAMFLVFVALGPSPVTQFAKLGLLGLLVLPVLLVTPAGEKIISLLPFVGSVEEENVTYRVRLLEISIQLIMEKPLFGGIDFRGTAAMEELRQGERGFIDMVNTYLGIGLASGFAGMSLFAGIFIAVGAGIFKGMRGLADRNDEAYMLGQALVAVLTGILLIIFTTSSVTVIPVIYWSVAGLGVAYARMLATAKAGKPLRPGGFQAAAMRPRF